MKNILWVLFISLAAYSFYQGSIVAGSAPEHYQLIKAESADSSLGRAMFRAWEKIPYGHGTLLTVVQRNTHTDYFFILTYTLLLLLCSYLQMQNETYLPLNSLLRLNILLALVIASLDITENIKILYNIRHLHDAGLYCSPYIVSTIKWLLSGWAVLIYLISLTRSALFSRRRLA